MLPHIDAQHHPLSTLFERRILVWRRDDVELAIFIDDEPCPAGAEPPEPGRVDFLGELCGRAGKAKRTWVMDRGIPTEEVLAEMRNSEPIADAVITCG
jgi:hypothetical protein